MNRTYNNSVLVRVDDTRKAHASSCLLLLLLLLPVSYLLGFTVEQEATMPNIPQNI